MKTLKRTLYVDVIGQSMIIFLSVFSLLLLFLELETGIRLLDGFIAFGMIFIAIWQLLSALIIGFRYSDTWRKKYLGFVLLWGINVLLLGFVTGSNGFLYNHLDTFYASAAFSILWIVAPLTMAILFFRHSIQHLKAAIAQPVSFWELV